MSAKTMLMIATEAMLLLGTVGSLNAAEPTVPRMQAIPLPRGEVSFTRDGHELTRYIADRDEKRPFFYPLVGPSGRSVTRMGHPRDPHGHSHHNSVWISFQNVAGTNFWEDRVPGRIAQRRILELNDSDDEATLIADLDWLAADDHVLLKERRAMRVRPGANGSWWLLLDLEFSAPAAEPVELGATAFGFLGVRMAKTIGVRDGGGRILNSEGAVNEKAVFRQPAKWVDYSGLIEKGRHEGILLCDHPDNFSYPSPFHVRDDGWMGASPCLSGPKSIEPGSPLLLRYGLWIHADSLDVDALNAEHERFAAWPIAKFPVDKK